jgi:EAL domain-containing protein (putative c-di-GMP-specific phosphodiesterase class I)
MGQARLDRLELVDDLRSAIQAAAIDLVYQPIVQVDSRRIVAVEVLARWTRGDSPVRPDVFISLAEETGLILTLGELVLRKVRADGPALRAAANGEPLTVGVNISAAQLRAPAFVASVARTVEALPDMSLTLEITERQGVDLEDVTLEAMRTITDMGVAFAIDDFGVGFSSISYLRDLPVQVLKVDAALTQAIDRDLRARALLRSIVMMGTSLGFQVVAEGIERETQLDVLREDAPSLEAQGYLLHRPMPLTALLPVLRQERAPAGRA